MLTLIEFMDKKHLVLDKANWTDVMNRIERNNWQVFSIKRDSKIPLVVQGEELTDEEAYEFYKERMESYGFKPFKILSE